MPNPGDFQIPIPIPGIWEIPTPGNPDFRSSKSRHSQYSRIFFAYENFIRWDSGFLSPGYRIFTNCGFYNQVEF